MPEMNKMLKIVVDAQGGDFAPEEIVKGSILSLQKINNIGIILFGKESIINNILSNLDYDKSRLEIINCEEIITNDESPTVAIKQKTNSSLVKALDLLKNDDNVIGLVSAGSTGAVLTGGFLKIGRIHGVSRPALAPILPTQSGGFVCLIDCGANMDTKPLNLAHFALMGSTYVKSLGIENPRVALLSVGVEDKKGNELTKASFEILKKLPINFVGNMEAREFLSGKYDVVVADGFAGNVLLKSSEGAVQIILNMLKEEIKTSFRAKIGTALFMSKTFKSIKQKLYYENYGGSPFLGAKKIIIKSHGDSKAFAISQSILQVVNLSKKNVYSDIETIINETNIDIEDNNGQ